MPEAATVFRRQLPQGMPLPHQPRASAKPQCLTIAADSQDMNQMTRALHRVALAIAASVLPFQLGAQTPGSTDATSACIPLDGMTFELTGSETFLVRKERESVALVRTQQFLPAGLSSMRFLADELCPSGAKSQFVVNETLYTVAGLQMFSGKRSGRATEINSAGTAATVTAKAPR